MTKLNRSLSLTECVFYGVGSILGAGIYVLIGKTAGPAGNLTWLAFLIASVCALFTALSYAELTTLFPKAGGEYVYAREAFGKPIGTVLGFIITLNGIVTGAAVSVGFAGYFNDLTGTSFGFVPMGILALIFLVNAAGVRHSSVVNIIFTLIEVGGLVLVIVCGSNMLGKVDLLELPPDGLNGLFTASALAFFAFVGFEEIVKLAEETHEPEKNIPRALFLTTAIVIVIYELVAISAVSAVPAEQLAESQSPLADVVRSRIGQTGIITISAIALFSTANTILSNMLGSSRILFNMSGETKGMKFLSRLSDRRKTPVAALILILGVMIAFSLIEDIEIIARIATTFIFITFLGVNLSVIVLRFRRKKLKRAYRVPFAIRGVPLPSLLGILFTLVLLVFNLIELFEGNS